MKPPAIIVHERQSRWATVLRRELAEGADRLRESRSSEQTRELLKQSAGSLLMIEFTAEALDAQLHLLSWLAERGPAPCTVSAGLAKYAQLAAEAGAAAHFTSLQQADALASLARRFLRLPQPVSHDTQPTELHVNWRTRLKWPSPAESLSQTDTPPSHQDTP